MTRAAIPAIDGKTRSRRFWSRWMKRALAPHEHEMAIPHQPVAAIDIELGPGEVEVIPLNLP